jgi:predicted molibdopterin-dependent oxidoreductase YjgC
MFRRLAPIAYAVCFEFEGRPLTAEKGESVALALLASGIQSCRDSIVSAEPRGPYCLMGACFECLVVIDGVPSCQGCQVEVKAGMKVVRQSGARAMGEATEP